MLIGQVRSAGQSGTRSLTYDDTTESFLLEGAGEIQPAKLIDFANRQEILWTDLEVRDWTLSTASSLLREAKAEAGRSRARAAAAALASGTGKHASFKRASARPSSARLRTSNGRLPSAPSEQSTPVPPSSSRMGFQPSAGPREGGANERQVQASIDSQAQALRDTGAPDVRHVWPWLILAALCVTVVGLGFAYPREIRLLYSNAYARIYELVPTSTPTPTPTPTPAVTPASAFNVMTYGAKGDGVTDDYHAIQAAINACGTSGGAVVFPRGTYLLNKSDAGALKLPAGNQQLLTLFGYGATIKLSANVPRFLAFNRTADHQLFAHFRVEGFAVDAQNATNGFHDVVGFGGQMTRINVDDVTVRYVHAYNLHKGDGSQIGISITCVQPTANEAVTDRITNVYIDHCQVDGGCLGFTVGGNEFGTSGYPRYPSIELDNINLTNCSWDSGVRSRKFWAASGAQMGWGAHGGRLYIANCDFRGSGDNSYEVNGWHDALVENCVSEDATNVGYYVCNWAAPLGGADGQQIIFRNCVHRQLTPMAGCRSWGLGSPSAGQPFGSLVLDRCSVESTVPDTGGASFLYSNHAMKAASVTLTGCSYRATGMQVSTAAWPFVLQMPGGGSPFGGPTLVEVANTSMYFRATRIGTPAYVVRLLSFSGDPNVRWNVHDCSFDTSISNGDSHGMRMVDLGAADTTTGGGVVDHCTFTAADNQPLAIQVGASSYLSIPGRVTVSNCDFGALATGGTGVYVTPGDSNQAKITTLNNLE